MAPEITAHIKRIRNSIRQEYTSMFRSEGGAMSYPFCAPNSSQYNDVLWDWDSWLTNLALFQILRDLDPRAKAAARPYMRGCVKNFLEYGDMVGWIPVFVNRNEKPTPPEKVYTENMHKPCLAQHCALLVKEDGGDAEWLREHLYALQCFANNYRYHHRHDCGLYFWQTDKAIGGDNDPCTFYRPPRSSGAVYLNCLMYRELLALSYLCEKVGLDEIAGEYRCDAEELKQAVREHCWDERDGFYYSVDLNLRPVQRQESWGPHSGQPREWPCLIQRIGVWSGFLALWAGIATPEQAERIVDEHYRDTKTFNAPFGVRTLSRMEKMYKIRASGNPSSWLGPVWGVVNYLVFRGLLRYEHTGEAEELATKTVRLFGRDIERFGALHEYYQPENGEPILNRGFQNWNYLVMNMIARLEGKEVVSEF